MALNRAHEIHTRRFGRNLGVGLLLVGFIAIIFGLTVVKVSRGDYEPPRAGQATEATQ